MSADTKTMAQAVPAGWSEAFEKAAVRWANARGTLDVARAEAPGEDFEARAIADEEAASLDLREQIGILIIQRFKK